MLNIRQLFKANCGPGAVYLGSEISQRGEHNVVLLQFEMVPEGRKFSLDSVIHGPGDAELEKTVLKIAQIARNIRAHINPDRPVVMKQ